MWNKSPLLNNPNGRPDDEEIEVDLGPWTCADVVFVVACLAMLCGWFWILYRLLRVLLLPVVRLVL